MDCEDGMCVYARQSFGRLAALKLTLYHTLIQQQTVQSVIKSFR